MKKIIYRGLAISLISVAISVIFWKTGIIEPLETLTWDIRVRVLVDQSEIPDNVVIVMLDQDSLDWGENEQGLSWPWPREILTPIINFVSRSGAKSIAFDVVYTEPSIYGVWDDEAFGSAIKSANNFIGAATLSHKEKNSWSKNIPPQEIIIEGLESWLDENRLNIVTYEHITQPIDEISYNAAKIANVHSEPDIDGVYRNGSLFYILNDRVVPSMALASYLTGSNKVNKLSIKKNILTINNMKIPLNLDGEVNLRFKGKYRTVKAAKVINSEIQHMQGETPTLDAEIFKDAYVFFGYSATGLLDLRATPLSGKSAGVEVHATMLDNLLTDDFIKKCSTGIAMLIVIVLTIIAGIIFTKYQGIFKGVVFYITFIAIPIIISALLYSLNIWFPLIFMESSVILTLTFAGLLNFATEGKQKRFIKNAFRQYLSPDFIEDILTNPGKLKLGGERKEITIFFSDLQGFTTISEGLSPEDLTRLINDYLTAMTDIILEEGGTIDKYEGDAIIAFWNAPISYEDHSIRAVRAALRCQEKLKEMRPAFYADIGHKLYMRIGINTGDAVVGNLGSNTRFDYTMLGDAVNLAARLEGINKQFGTYTMISHSTYENVKEVYSARELAKVKVVGKNKEITVYEPMQDEEYNKKKKVYDIFHKGLLKFYSGNFKDAIAHFEALTKYDKTSVEYKEKCEELLKEKPANWDGIWKLTQK